MAQRTAFRNSEGTGEEAAAAAWAFTILPAGQAVGAAGGLAGLFIFNSTSHPGGKLGKLQLNNRRPTCLLLASLRPSRYNMEQNYTPR